LWAEPAFAPILYQNSAQNTFFKAVRHNVHITEPFPKPGWFWESLYGYSNLKKLTAKADYNLPGEKAREG
jgi:hypothetical protein